MADLTLNKPAAGAQNVINAVPDSRIELNFPTDQATLERSGNDLVFRFDDGSSIVIRDFYTAYTKENMPDFVLEGTPISGEQFFTALNGEDLMPAAGPAANAGNANGGRFHEFGDDPLQSGVDRLDGLDLSSSRAFFPERDPWGGLRGDDAGTDPLTPEEPVNPADPVNPVTPNANPIISATGAVTVVESGVLPGGNTAYAGVPSQSGAITASDADGDALNFGLIDADGAQVNEIATEYGTIVMNPDGTYTYTIDNDDPDTNSLALGETREETFTVYVDDGNGGVTTQEITVTITGTNDRPELTLSAGALSVIESGVGRDAAGNVITSNIPAEENASYAGRLTSGAGQAQGTDVDHGAVLTYGVASGATGDPRNSYFTATDSTQGHSSVTAGGAYGDLTLNNDGSYSYTLHPATDANLNGLHEGQIVTETFTVYVRDEHGAWTSQELTVNVTGTNDRPEISHVDELVLKETGVQSGGNEATTPEGTIAPEGDAHRLTATGHVTADDVDNDDDAGTLRYSFADGQTSISTELGGVTIDQNGNYTYTLNDGAANSLAQGETRTETFTVMVTDSHGATHEAVVNVTIYGTNDIPTLELRENVLNVTESGVGRDENGNVITSNGEEENGSYTGSLSASGTAVGNDVDNGASWTYGLGVDGVAQYTDNGPRTAVGEYGTLTLNPDGTYTYTLFPEPNTDDYEGGTDNPEYQRALELYNRVNDLSEGETHPETFTIYVRDEHGAWTSQTLTVNVVGTNDQPVIDEITKNEGDEELVVKEQGVHEKDGEPNTETTDTAGTPGADEHKGGVSGTIIASDPDKDNGSGSQTDGTGNHDLAFGVIGGTSALNGGEAQDIPSSSLGGDFNYQTYTGTDAGGTVTLYHTITTQYGTLTIDENGNYTYELNESNTDEGNPVNQLGEGDSVTETFTVQVMDKHGATHEQTITITVQGTNDIPVLTVDNPNLTIDDSVLNDDGTPVALTVGGHADVFDVDGGAANDADTLTFGLQFTGTTKVPDWQTGSVGAGEPTYAGSTIGDMDNVTVKGTYGELTIGKDGDYTYTLNNSKGGLADQLTENDHPVETFTIWVKDEHGAWAKQEITITVNGVNDAPVIDEGANPHMVLKEAGVVDTGTAHGVTTDTDDEGRLTEKGYSRLQAEGDIKASDVDHGNVPDFSVAYGGAKGDVLDGAKTPDVKVEGEGENKVTTIETQYGTLTLDQSGHYIYKVNEKGAQALNQGDKVTEEFKVTVSDGHGGTVETTITVDVLGSNDRPTVEASGPSNELTDPGYDGANEVAGTTTATGTYAGKDDDSGEVLHFNEFGISLTDGNRDSAFDQSGNGVHELTGAYGKLTIDEYGKYTYELDTTPGGNADRLAGGASETDTFYIYVKDDHGAWNRTEVTFTIHGTNDAPVIAPDETQGSLKIYEEGVWGDREDPDKEHNPDAPFNGYDASTWGKLSGHFSASDVEGDKLTYFFKGIDENGTIAVTHDGVSETLAITGVTKDAEGNVTGFTTKYGDFTLADDGKGGCTYTFAPNQTGMNALSQDETFNFNVQIGVKDEHGAGAVDDHDVSVSIIGTNDRPVAKWTDLNVKEFGVKDGGNVETESDGSDKSSSVSSDKYRHETQFQLRAEDADNDGQDLTYAISNKTTAINGTDYIASKYHETLGAAGTDATGGLDRNEGVKVLGRGETPATDSHLSEGYDQYIQTNYGTLYLDSDTGKCAFVLAPDTANWLPQGSKLTFNFDFTVTDIHGSTGTHSILVNIQGTNDKPTLALETSDSVDHAGQAFITATDGADNGNPVYEKTDDGNPDVTTFVVKEAGTTTEGDKVGSDVYTGKAFGADDDYGHTLTYGVSGYKENPENANAAFNGNAKGEPVTEFKGTYGTLTINLDGTYTYTLNDTANRLDEGQNGQDTFSIFVRDEHGAWAVQNVAFDVEGSDDAPIVGKISDVNLREEGAHGSSNYTWHAQPEDAYSTDDQGNRFVTFKGDLSSSVTIVDNGDRIAKYSLDAPADKDHPFTVTTDGDSQILTNEFLTITLNTKTGEYTATLNMTAANRWQEGYDPSYGFKVTVTDSDGITGEGKLTVNLHGANDLPTLTIDTSEDTTNDFTVADRSSEDGTVAKGSVTASDPDAGDKLSFSIFKQGASNDKTFHVPGEYDADQRIYNEENFKQWMEDYQDSKDNPLTNLSGDRVNNWFLGTPKADTYATEVHGKYGTLTINGKTGEYTYKLDDPSVNPNVRALGEGEKVTEDFSIMVKDSKGAFDIKDIHFEITGSADAAQLVTTDAHVLQITEAGVVPGGNEAKNVSNAEIGKFTVKPVDDPGAEGEHLVFGFKIGDKYEKAFWTGEDGQHSPAIETPYGTLTITGITHNDDGTWTATYEFTLNNSLSAVQQLKEGDLVKLHDALGGLKLAVWDDRHPVTEAGQPTKATDQALDLYIHGSNDRPYFTDGDGNRKGEDNDVVDLKSASISEDGNSITGTLTGEDYEGDKFTFSLVDDNGVLVQKLAGEYGILELKPDGSYTYTLTPAGSAKLQTLHEGQNLADLSSEELSKLGLEAETFHVRITDSNGAFNDGNLVIDIRGETDTPTIADVKATILEDDGVDINHAADPSITGTLTPPQVVDAAHEGKVTWTAGDYTVEDGLGTLHVDEDGGYTYTLAGNEGIQDWNIDDSVTETFEITVTLPNGDTVTQNVAITIKGTNDSPTFSVENGKQEGWVTHDVFEDKEANKGDHGEGAETGVVFTGTLGGGTDIDDAGSSLRYRLLDEHGNLVTELKTTYGTIVLHDVENNGGSITTHYTYTLDNESVTLEDALKALEEGEFLDDTIKYVAVDPHGSVSVVKDADGKIISGTNDLIIHINDASGSGGGEEANKLVIDAESKLTGDVTEDGNTDGDEGTSQSFAGQLVAKWADGRSHGDTPPNRVFGIVEKVYDANTDTWVDKPDGGQAQGHVASDGKYGYIVIDPATGEYKYTLYNGENGKSNPVQDLAAGETVTEKFTVMLNGEVQKDTDGNAITIDITITGTNDAPVITNIKQPDAIKENETGGLTDGTTVDGTVTGLDIDHKLDDQGNRVTDEDGNAVTEDVTYWFHDGEKYVETITTKYGSITINKTTGEYTFTLDVSKLVDENGNGIEGVQVIRDADGNITGYHLPEGRTLTDAITVYASDGTAYTPGTINVTINGTNWGPEAVIAGISQTVHEDAVAADDEQSAFSGTLNDLFTDDQGAGNLTYAIKDALSGSFLQGKYGSLELVNGEYKYVLNNESDAVQGLDAKSGGTGTDTFTIIAKDERGETTEITITVDVKGKNDEPTLSVDKVLSVREGADADSDSGTATGLDKDTGELLQYGFGKDDDGNVITKTTVKDADGNAYGTLTVDKNGKYTFTLDNTSDAVKALNPGELKELTQKLHVYDTTGLSSEATITIDIIGANTAPENLNLTPSEDNQPLIEGATGTYSGTAHATDIDAGSSAPTYGFLVGGKIVQSFTGEYGTFTIDATTGKYTYTLDKDTDNSKLNALAEDQPGTDTVQIVAVDGYGAQSRPESVTVNIKGTNDAPVIAVDTTNGMNGSFTFSDVDADDTHSVTFDGLKGSTGADIKITGKGEFSVYEDGKTIGTLKVTEFSDGPNGKVVYEFIPDKAYTDGIERGEGVELHFKLSVDDGNTDGKVEGTTEHTFTVTSSNEAPTVGDATESNNGSLAITDGDGDTVSTVKVEFGKDSITLGKGESLTLNDVTFTYDGSNLTYAVAEGVTNGMKPGASDSLSFSVTLDDGHGEITHNVSLPLASTNTAPTASDGEGTPDADNHILTGQITASDDHTQDLKFSLDEDGQYGTVSVNESDGSYTYTLKEGVPNGTAADSFTINVNDGHGGITPVKVTVNLMQLNTAPELDESGDKTNDTESSIVIGNEQVTGELHVTDANSTDALTLSNVTNGQQGTVTAELQNGVITYTYKPGDDVKAGTDSFTLTVSDGFGGTADVTVNISIEAAAQPLTSSFSLMSFFRSAHMVGGENLNADGLAHNDLAQVPGTEHQGDAEGTQPDTDVPDASAEKADTQDDVTQQEHTETAGTEQAHGSHAAGTVTSSEDTAHTTANGVHTADGQAADGEPEAGQPSGATPEDSGAPESHALVNEGHATDTGTSNLSGGTDSSHNATETAASAETHDTDAQSLPGGLLGEGDEGIFGHEALETALGQTHETGVFYSEGTGVLVHFDGIIETDDQSLDAVLTPTGDTPNPETDPTKIDLSLASNNSDPTLTGTENTMPGVPDTASITSVDTGIDAIVVGGIHDPTDNQNIAELNAQHAIANANGH